MPKRKVYEMIRVQSVEPLDGFKVYVKFTDGFEKIIDLEPVIWGPVFEPIRNDPAFFRQVYVDPVSETLTWPNEVDLDPDSLYYGNEMPPWWKDYYARQEKKKARALRERKAKLTTRTRRKTTKAKTKRAVKKTTRQKTIAVEKK